MRRAFVLLCVTTLFACDDGDSSGGFSSGLEPTKTISSLTDAEGQAYCDSMSASFAGLISKRKSCELASVFFTDDPATCRTFTDQCVQAPDEAAEPEPGFEEGDDTCTIAEADNRAGCEESIEALDACTNAVQGLIRTNLGKISCSDAGNTAGLEQTFTGLPEGPQDIPGCEALAMNCPKLFEDEALNSAGPLDDTRDQ